MGADCGVPLMEVNWMRTHSVLSEYNPLGSVFIPGVEMLAPHGIVVIVGPNSSGKTLLLRDIERFLLTGQTEFIVCNGLTARMPPDIGALIDELIARRYIQEIERQGVNQGRYQVLIPFMGS